VSPQTFGRLRSALRGGAAGGRVAAPSAPREAMLELARAGPAALREGGARSGELLSLAIVIPSFRRGSGGHATIVALARALSGLGLDVSIWLEDFEGRHAQAGEMATAEQFAEFFNAAEIPFHSGFKEWAGADVVIATGWQTAPRVLLLPNAGGRAYLVQDHEPEFYATSAESLWAAATYREEFHCIAASPWLAELLRTRYGVTASHFDLALDHSIYRPAKETVRREDLVVFYARAATPRRAVPLGLSGLEELAHRRPDLEIVLYGEASELPVRFPARQVGVLDGPALGELYSQASVGMVLSLTNPSLISLEMAACGLPCVELASESMVATFGAAGPLTLAEGDPIRLCEAIEGLLDDPQRRQGASRRGLALVAERSWDAAALQVIEGLRTALA